MHAHRKSGAQLGLSEADLIVDVVVEDVVIVVVDVIGFGNSCSGITIT